ncbi:MAG: repressor LexA, partial [Myxococcota bacterium]
MNDLPSLTPRQKQVLNFIEERLADWGYPPTIREIGEHLSIRSTNGVADHLKALKRKGYLTQRDMKSRTLLPVSLEARVAQTSTAQGSRSKSPGRPKTGVVRVMFPQTNEG